MLIVRVHVLVMHGHSNVCPRGDFLLTLTASVSHMLAGPVKDTDETLPMDLETVESQPDDFYDHIHGRRAANIPPVPKFEEPSLLAGQRPGGNEGETKLEKHASQTSRASAGDSKQQEPVQVWLGQLFGWGLVRLFFDDLWALVDTNNNQLKAAHVVVGSIGLASLAGAYPQRPIGAEEASFSGG